MTTYAGGYGDPGIGSETSTVESEIFWGGDQSKLAILWKSDRFSSTLADASASPTTAIRPGMILGRLTADGLLTEWDADASDGSQNIAGVLDIELKMIDFNGTAATRTSRNVVQAPVKARKLLIQGSAFVGHADEYLARRQMVAAGFVFDDDPFGYKAGATTRYAQVTGTTDSLTADENGSTIFYNNAASVTVTLPAIKAGLEYDLIRNGNEEFIVTSAAGDDIIFGNDLSGDSVTFTTASEHLGARVRVKSVYMGTTLKWLMELPNAPFGTAVGSAVTVGLAS